MSGGAAHQVARAPRGRFLQHWLGSAEAFRTPPSSGTPVVTALWHLESLVQRIRFGPAESLDFLLRKLEQRIQRKRFLVAAKCLGGVEDQHE